MRAAFIRDHASRIHNPGSHVGERAITIAKRAVEQATALADALGLVESAPPAPAEMWGGIRPLTNVVAPDLGVLAMQRKLLDMEERAQRAEARCAELQKQVDAHEHSVRQMFGRDVADARAPIDAKIGEQTAKEPT